MPQFVADDAVTLHYTDTGEGPPVVLIAGFRAPASSWVFQVPALAAAGHRVLCLDRRGHGLSAPSLHGHRIARHAADLAQFLTHVGTGADDAVLVGASMGASVVWSYLDTFGTSQIRGVIAVDQTPRMSNSDDWPYGFYGYDASNLGTFFANGPPVHTGHGTPAPIYQQRLGQLTHAMGAAAHQIQAGPLSGGELALLLDHAVQDWRDVIQRTTVPQLLVAGDHSEFWPAQHASAAASTSDMVDAEVVEDCGHAVPWEAPEQFNAILLRFLSDLTGDASKFRTS